ncbi:MAG: hypothetical protein ABW173_11120, partial [Sphingomonas sp.]
QAAYNRAARAIAARDPRGTYGDGTTPMLRDGASGPYVVADGIHMNAAGYRLWRDAIHAALRATPGERAFEDCYRNGPSPQRGRRA